MAEKYLPDVYKDIATPYAVYKIIKSADGASVQDAQYVFVNDKYCELANIRREDLIGHTFKEVYRNTNRRWMEYCYQAGVLKREIRDCLYSKEAGHWLEFVITPAQQEGYVAYIFMNMDEDQYEKMLIEKSNRTDHAILNITKILNNNEDYSLCMNHALNELSFSIYSDRIYLLEINGNQITDVFEWHKETLPAKADEIRKLTYSEYLSTRQKCLERRNDVAVLNIEALKKESPEDYQKLQKKGIHSFLNIPLYDDHKQIGYLAIDNYEANNLMNNSDILRTVAYYMAAKIANHQLMNELNYMSLYDDLTGIHNRNAFNNEEDRLVKMHISLGIIFLDVNGLKQLNDRNGHRAGDEALKRVGQMLAQYYDKENVYRIGGDEFLILLDDVSQSSFRKKVALLGQLSESLDQLTIAYGSSWIKDSAKLNKAMMEADAKMYENKAEYYRHHNRRQRHYTDQ